MKLVQAGASPFVRKVMVLLQEAGKTGEFEMIDGFGSAVAPNPNVVAANPLGKIPCLILDNGESLYDSRVITRYLDQLYGAGMYPEGDALWTTLRLEALADGALDAGVLCVYEIRCREESERSEAWLKGQRDKISRALDELEANWLDYLGGHFDMGVVAVGCVLGYLDFRAEMGGFGDWREGRPGLAAWGDAFLARPSMKATAPTL